MSIASCQGKAEASSFFYYKAFPLLDLLLNLWQNESDSGWLPCLLQLWTNSLCSHLVSLQLFPQLIVEAPMRPVCTVRCVDPGLQPRGIPTDVSPQLVVCSAPEDAVSQHWVWICSLYNDFFDYLVLVWYLSFVIRSHLFGILGGIKPFLSFLFAVFCVTVSCCSVVKKRMLQNTDIGPISFLFKSTFTLVSFQWLISS